MPTKFPRYLADNVRNAARGGALATTASSSVKDSWSWWTEAETKLFTQWGSAFEAYSDSFNNPYFDYFYTGQDVQITIDGLTDADDILPIYSFGYNIQQQKTPLFGFWNYTYSAMLRGTRIVSGAFSVVSMYPHLMTSKIAKAAKNRAAIANGTRQGGVYALRGLDDDEANIDRFWGRTYDNNLDVNQQHLFSVHPPFNFIIKYGMQDTSAVASAPSARAQEIRSKFTNTDPMMSDYNERLIRNPTPELDVPILLEQVEIVSKSVEYDSEGNPLLETYAFIARDERFAPAPLPSTASLTNNMKSNTKAVDNSQSTNTSGVYGSDGVYRF